MFPPKVVERFGLSEGSAVDSCIATLRGAGRRAGDRAVHGDSAADNAGEVRALVQLTSSLEGRTGEK